MIVTKSLSEARILVVGAGVLVDEILRNLASHGAHNITVMDAESTASKSTYESIKKDPLEYISQDGHFFKSFDLVLAANQPRPFEVALSDLRWPKDASETDPDLPMMVMRSVENNCKFRCQYRELKLPGGGVSKFVSLPMNLLPWTDEKRKLVTDTVREEFKPKPSSKFQAWFASAAAVVGYHEQNGSWPGPGDKSKVQKLVSGQAGPAHDKFVDQFCDGGLASAPETIEVLARFIALDATRLLTGNGQPVNNSNIDDIITLGSTVE